MRVLHRKDRAAGKAAVYTNPANRLDRRSISLGGEKKIVIQVSKNGEITGTLEASYNRAIATRAHDGVDAVL
jgi:hypothetical protein